jgi:dipeptidyl aminopeptidase/acylaminoacyl peptidase
LREGTLLAQRFDLRRLDLAGEAARVAEQVSNYAAFGQFSSSQTGALVYRSGGRSGFARITWFDRQGKSVGTPSEAGYGPGTLTLSPDGSRAATERVEGTGSNLWLLEFARGGRTRFTYGPGQDRYAAWSPNGTKIAFSSQRAGHFDLYQHAADGAGEDELLFKSTDNKIVNDWSRDGRFLLYGEQSAKGGTHLWVLPMDDAVERKPARFLRMPSNELEGRFSPDGRWIAYASDESGRSEIYVRPFPTPAGGGGRWMVSQGGGFAPRWRRDGTELFYIGAGGQVMASGVSASGAAFKPGVPKPLFKVQIAPRADWDVSADGTKFLFPIMGSETTQSPFTVVLNWISLLKR